MTVGWKVDYWAVKRAEMSAALLVDQKDDHTAGMMVGLLADLWVDMLGHW
jgi:hypothetical protein